MAIHLHIPRDKHIHLLEQFTRVGSVRRGTMALECMRGRYCCDAKLRVEGIMVRPPVDGICRGGMSRRSRCQLIHTGSSD